LGRSVNFPACRDYSPKAICFLASDDARFVSGAALLVDAGTLA
jgi:hypothetical protein